MRGPDVEDFERYLEIWRKLYVLDDALYLKIIGELDLDIDPAMAYAYLIRFLELWGVRRAAIRISPEELSSKIAEVKSEIDRLDSNIFEVDLDWTKWPH